MDSRIELQLRKILGEDVDPPAPMSRVEELLAQIVAQGGVGGGGTAGKGIQKIEKTGTQGLVDTYTITYTDNSTFTFTVTNGKDGQDGEDGEDAAGDYLPLSGGTMTGNLLMGGHEIYDAIDIEANNSVSGKYLRALSRDESGLVTDIVMLNISDPGVLSIGSNVRADGGVNVILRGLDDPVEDDDAATKAYVDSKAGGSGGIFNVTENTTLEQIYNAGTSGKLVIYKMSSMCEDILIFERYVKQGDTNYIFLAYPIISTVGSTTIDGLRGYTFSGVGTNTIATAQLETTYVDFTKKADVVSQTDHGTSDTTFTLPPNQFHIWGEVSSLTLTLGTAKSGVVNEYHFSFASGDTATTLSLPDTVDTDIVVEPNMYYECSIINNRMTFREWEVSS